MSDTQWKMNWFSQIYCPYLSSCTEHVLILTKYKQDFSDNIFQYFYKSTKKYRLFFVNEYQYYI